MKATRQQLYEIRRKKDERYENTFFIGVWSRGVFCRVTCPDKLPDDPSDMVYFHSIYEALEEGLLPCKDCEPDMYSEQVVLNRVLSNEVNNAVNLIDEGFLNINKISDMAERLFVSERHLRRLFQNEVGISPTKIAMYQRALFAKKMIYETDMKMTDIAFASGFNSIRDFNHVFKKVFQITPSDIRRESIRNHSGTEDIMNIPYHDGFDFAEALSKVKKYLIPEIAVVDDNSYTRAFSITGIDGCFVINDDPENKCLKVTIYAEDKRCYMGVYHRIQRMFGLMDKHQDMVLGFNPYEVAVRAILNHAYGEERGREISRNLIILCNEKLNLRDVPIKYIYPDVHHLTEEIVSILPIEKKEKDLIVNFNKALNTNAVTLAYNQNYDSFCENMMKIEGMNRTVVEKIARIGLGMNEFRNPFS